MAFEIKKNDRRPHYRIQLTEADPADPTGETQVPTDLTDATSAGFTMKAAAGAIKISLGAMTFIDRPNGIVEYPWAAGDTDTAGTFTAEIQVLWGTEPQTFPSKGYFTVTIEDDLA